MTTNDPGTMSDRQLLDATMLAARDERHAMAELIAFLAEVDVRRLFLGEGCSSLFTYCTQVLHLSEHAAYHRIEAARAARRFPVIFGRLADGEITLTTVAMLRPHLTDENHEALLAAARHKSKRDVEHQIACLAPKPAVVAMITQLPEMNAAVSHALPLTAAPTHVSAPARALEPRSVVTPLASERYLLRVTLTASGQQHLRRAQDLMRHAVPSADPAAIVEHALEVLVTRLEKMRFARTSRPRRPTSHADRSASDSGRARDSRHIAADVKRVVWARDEGQCAFVGPRGRCTETGRLEFHHVIPFARGGPATTDNIALRCRAHNQYESEQIFGPWLPPDNQLGPDRVAHGCEHG